MLAELEVEGVRGDVPEVVDGVVRLDHLGVALEALDLTLLADLHEALAEPRHARDEHERADAALDGGEVRAEGAAPAEADVAEAARVDLVLLDEEVDGAAELDDELAEPGADHRR